MFTCVKSSSCFTLKDQTDIKHKHDLVYRVTCPDVSCDAQYIGEVSRRFEERVIDHSGRDVKSHVAIHSVICNHQNVTFEDFDILRSGYNNNAFKRKLSEALYIKEYKPSLNIQDKSVPLQLYN